MKFHTSLLFAMVFLLISCSRKALPEKEETHPDEPMQNVSLDKFLKRVQVNVEKHQWKDFLDKCDSASKSNQLVGMKLKEPQYIAMLLGIADTGNSVVVAPTEITLDDLNKIAKARITEYEEFINGLEAFGRITMNDGRKLKIRLRIGIKNNNYYLLEKNN